ncbi:MAG: hypothetical protein KKB03_01510 [Nanoarchaeota archaeon]|nr:hypothetical protein [Nanoarchaeota archaeon]MBU1135245.1 hypothetical protein [Nanoarchaeota archaeon]MBU2519905.1 hypothetical protein [Nanoarchaeota archaeon]
MKKITISDRLISGVVYLLLFLPMGFLGFLYVHFHYGKKNKFMRSHADNAGLLFVFQVVLSFFVIIIPHEMTVFYYLISDNILLWFLTVVLNCSVLIFSITAFMGRLYKISNLFNWVKK